MPTPTRTTLNAHTRAQIEDLTQANCHSEAALLLARALGNTPAIETMERILATCEELGYTPQELCDQRYEVMTPLWDAVRR